MGLIISYNTKKLSYLTFQVTEDEKVSTVKELVSKCLNIPTNQQRLLYKGKALAGRLSNRLMFLNPYVQLFCPQTRHLHF